MGRIFIMFIVPLVLPTVGWIIWRVFLAKPTLGPDGTPLDPLDEALPWGWLAPAGVVALVVVLGSLAFYGGARPGDVYVSPRLVDGKVVPGQHLAPDKRD